MLSNKTYDILKKITMVMLPGLGTLYFTLAGIWGLPNAEAVVGTIAAITVFLGIALGFSTKSYDNGETKYDGTIEVQENEGKKTFILGLNEDPGGLDKKRQVLFKIDSK